MTETLVERLPPVVDISSERQLFLDDHLIDSMESVGRFVHPPIKRAENPVFVVEEPWEGSRFLYCDVVRDGEEGVYKLWYSVLSGDAGQPALCYALSEDGVHFRRPELGLVEFAGSKANNLLVVPGGFSCDKSVIRDDREQDPERRYKMMFYTSDGVGVAWSADGLTWASNAGNPVLCPTGDASQSAFWDERCGLYVMFLRPNGRHQKRTWRKRGVPYDASAFPTRRMGRAESIDFERWTDIEEVLAPDERDGTGTEFYYMPVLPYQGGYVGFLNVYHEFTGDSHPLAGFNYTLDVQLTYSRDGRKWTRVGDRQVFLRGDSGAWDEKRIYVDHAQVEEEEIRLYYRGSDIPHYRIGDLLGQEHGGRRLCGDSLGVAELRLDGFVSIQAGEREGALTTRSLRFAGGSALRVNADASGGELRVEVLTLYGAPVPGLTREECVPLIADCLDQEVQWRGGKRLAEVEQPVRLRFLLRQSRLYSFQIIS